MMMHYPTMIQHDEDYFCSSGDTVYIKIDVNLLKQILSSKGEGETIKDCLNRLLNPKSTEKPIRHLDLDD